MSNVAADGETHQQQGQHPHSTPSTHQQAPAPSSFKFKRNPSFTARVGAGAPSPLSLTSPVGRRAKAAARERAAAAERATAAAAATAAGLPPPVSEVSVVRRNPRKPTRRQAESLHALQASLEGMGAESRANANSAAALVQRRWRQGKQHIFLIESLRRVYSQPDIEKAKKHAESFLPKDRFGNLYPLSTPFKSFHSMGCGVALYMYIIHWWACLFFVLSLITVGLTFLYIEGRGLSVANRNVYTFHSLGNAGVYYNATAAIAAAAAAIQAAEQSGGGFAELIDTLPSPPPELPASYGAVELLIAIILVWFVHWQHAKVRGFSRKIMHNDTTAANYTVMVNRMPAVTRSTPELIDFFSRWGDVVHATVAYNHRDLILATTARAQAREALHAAHVKWYLSKVEAYPQSERERASRAVGTAKHRLWTTGMALKALCELEPVCTSHVFVTFDSVDAAQACIAGCAAEKKYYQGSGPLSVSMAPEPEDVIWENLQYTRAQQTSRFILSSLIILCITILNTTLITVASVFQSQVLARYSDGGANAPTLIYVIGVFVLCTVTLILCYVSTILTVPLLAFKLERWHQFANRETAILVKLAIFQVLNVIAPSAVFSYVNDWSMAGTWYATGGALVLNSLIGDLFVVNFGIDLLRPDVLIFRRVLAPHAKTQRQMNLLYNREASIYLAFRLQLCCKFFVCGLIFSTAFPVLNLICCAMMVAAGWIDRYNFLRVFSPPPPTSDRLITFVARVITPVAAMGHIVMSFVFFRAIDVERGVTSMSWASSLSLAAIIISGPPIVHFCIREHLSPAGRRRVGILPEGPRMRTFREWFLDITDDAKRSDGRDANSRWLPTMSFRETPELGIYLPPLPRSLQVDKVRETAANYTFAATRGSRSFRVHSSSRQRLENSLDEMQTPSTPPDGGGGALPPRVSLNAQLTGHPIAHTAPAQSMPRSRWEVLERSASDGGTPRG